MFIQKIFPIVALSLISGCSMSISNGAEQARVYEERHPITLRQKENNLEIPIEPEQQSLTQIQKSKLKGFLYKYNQNSKDTLIVTVPESGMNVTSARKLVKEVVSITHDIGINQEHVKVGTYQPFSEKSGSIRISFESLVTEASSCNDMWSENLVDAFNNEVSKGHGCATRNNLAAMIVRPEDLVQMPTMSPGIARRRVGVFDKFILGENTSAAKGETASATDQ